VSETISTAPRLAHGRATTDASFLLSLALAAPLYGLSVLGAYALPKGVRDLLLDRGWVPHAVMVLTWLALVVLLLKAVGLRRQRRDLRLEVLPSDTTRIGPDNVGAVAEHVHALRSQRARMRKPRSLLLERVARTLDHYAARGDAQETAAANTADADADAASVGSSFGIVKVLVWAIPILGFIGTVIGISDAVGGFSRSLAGADQLDAIKRSLGEVTTGLAVAFDTTLVALVASILVMVPTSWLQKAEEALVSDVDDRVVTDVLRRLSAPATQAPAPAPAPAEALTAADVRALIDETIATPLAEMLSAHARLMNRMAEDQKALASFEGALGEQLSAFAVASRSIGPAVERAAAGLEKATSLAEAATTAAGRAQDQLARELGASRELLQLLAAGLRGPDPEPAVATTSTNGRARAV
jgi:biopolymer transport protein ExbB/TolQ